MANNQTNDPRGGTNTRQDPSKSGKSSDRDTRGTQQMRPEEDKQRQSPARGEESRDRGSSGDRR